MALVLLAAPGLVGIVRAVKARLQLQRARRSSSPTARSPACSPRRSARRERLLAFPTAPYHLRTHLGCRLCLPHLLHPSRLCPARRPHRHDRPSRRRALPARSRRARYRHQLRRHRREPKVTFASLADPATAISVVTPAIAAGLDRAFLDRRLHALPRGRPSRLLRACPRRPRHRRLGRKWAHPGGQSRDASRGPPWCTRRWCSKIRAGISR